MATPCEEKGYEVGQVFEISEEYNSDMYGKTGDLIVLVNDDSSTLPEFRHLSGDAKGAVYCKSLREVNRIYPPEEPKAATETITLFGNEYDKAEIESALKGVLPVGESL